MSFAGSATSALMGFVTTFIIARLLGEVGAGVVFQAMAVFTIAVSISKFGMDSVAIWLLPRLRSSAVGELRGALTVILSSAALLGAVGGAVAMLGSRVFAGGSAADAQLVEAVFDLGWFVPVGALSLVLLGAIRGLGALWSYVAIGSIGLPVIRPLVIAAVAMSGGSAVAVTVAWAAPLPLTVIAAFVCLRLQVLPLERRAGLRPSYRPSPGQFSTITRFALPRTVSAALEQSINWMQVLLVGAIAGSAAAGIYGGASRLMAAGLIVDTAVRVIVSPRFSSLLHENDLDQAQVLYRTTAVWLVLFSAPVYVVLALFASTVLGWLGPGFVAATGVLVTLCAGVTLALVAGNIHSVLLMSGRSGWAAVNKTVNLVVNVGLSLLLIRPLGIEGAALAFVAGQLLDAVLAYVEVRRFIGLRTSLGPICYALAVPVLSIGVPGWVIRWQLGPHLGSLALTLAVGGALFVVWCRLDRRRLHLTDLGLGRRST